MPKYMRYPAGSDAALGDTFASALKTPSGIVAGKVTAGETVRWEKSSDPVSSGLTAAWVKGQRTLALSAPLPGTITIFRGESDWTVASGVTAVAGTNQFRGDSVRGSAITIAAGATTGKVAHALVENGPLDLTDYTRISFYCFITTTTLTANNLSIKLCSDTAGNTPVATASLPALPVASRWYKFTLDLTGTLGAGIQSIAIYMDVDVAPAQPLYFDNFICCKAAGTPGAIDYHTLIGMSSDPENEEWYVVEGFSADMDTIYLGIGSGSVPNPTAAQQRPYFGESYTGTLYHRGTIVIPSSQGIPTGGAVTGFNIAMSGSLGNRLKFSGGWDPADNMETQNGLTIFSSEHCDGGWLFTAGNDNYIEIERIGGSGFAQTWRLDGCTGWYFHSLGCNASTSTAFIGVNPNFDHYIARLGCGGMNLGTILQFTTMYRSEVHSVAGDVIRSCGAASASSAIYVNTSYDCKFYFEHVRLDNNNGYGLTVNNAARCLFGPIGSLSSNTIYGLNFTGYNFDHVFRGCPEVWNNTTAGFDFVVETINCWFYNFNTLGNGTPIRYGSIGTNYFKNLVIQEVGGEVANWSVNTNGKIVSVDHDGTPGNLVIFHQYGLIRADEDFTYDGAIRSVLCQPSSLTDCNIFKPLDAFCWEFEMEPDVAYTFKVRAHRDNAGITGCLLLEGGQLAGLPTADTRANLTTVGEWEELSIGPFTATEKGVVHLHGHAYGGNSYNVWFNDVSHTQA